MRTSMAPCYMHGTALNRNHWDGCLKGMGNLHLLAHIAVDRYADQTSDWDDSTDWADSTSNASFDGTIDLPIYLTSDITADLSIAPASSICPLHLQASRELPSRR